MCTLDSTTTPPAQIDMTGSLNAFQGSKSAGSFQRIYDMLAVSNTKDFSAEKSTGTVSVTGRRARQYVAAKMVSLFVFLFGISIDETDSTTLPSLKTFVIDSVQQGSNIWLLDDYNYHFRKIPELTELTTTPFMVEVVTEILPELSVSRRTTNEYKSSFVMLLGTEIAEVVWELMQEKTTATDKTYRYLLNSNSMSSAKVSSKVNSEKIRDLYTTEVKQDEREEKEDKLNETKEDTYHSTGSTWNFNISDIEQREILQNALDLPSNDPRYLTFRGNINSLAGVITNKFLRKLKDRAGNIGTFEYLWKEIKKLLSFINESEEFMNTMREEFLSPEGESTKIANFRQNFLSKIDHILFLVLKRQATYRHMIYEYFLEFYFKQALIKAASNRSSQNSATVGL